MRPTYVIEPAITAKARLSVGLPVLAGEPEETLFRCARPAGVCGEFEIQEAGQWIVGRATVALADGLERSTRRLYMSLFAASEGLHLCRVWHYLPTINETGADGLENYRAFCHGRSLAFETRYGAGFRRRLPSASAVGTEDEQLTIVFAACKAEPKHFENPRQLPAYDYPKQHGPRPPSFSRATVIPHEEEMLADVFISGTAAIEGHETVAPGDTAGQIVRTLGNLRAISQACGLGSELGATRCAERHFKVYLRHATDLAAITTALDDSLLMVADKVSYLRADICRKELNLEIEATILGARIG
jgi:enamine deaminase RidA (YjgF/YER057c/UK114 family)